MIQRGRPEWRWAVTVAVLTAALHGISCVFHGPRERELGGFDPSAAPFLELVFQRGDVAIYQVAEVGGS